MIASADIYLPAGILGLLLIVLVVWLALEVSMRLGGSLLGLLFLLLVVLLLL